jgi:hypothetical protein
MRRLNRSDYRIRVFRGLEADIKNGHGAEGELLYTTDTKKLYVHDGTEYLAIQRGATGTFTTNDSKTVTVADGLIVSII